MFKGMKLWEIVVCALYLALVFVGGLIGGLTGAAGAIVNIKI